jgi:hypothetical protein
MAGYWDIFPKNDFCRTNHLCLINQAENQFYKAIFNWPRSWRSRVNFGPGKNIGFRVFLGQTGQTRDYHKYSKVGSD